MYTVTFCRPNEAHQISRFFETVRAAHTWCKWLAKQSFVIEIKLYRGQAGEELLQTIAGIASHPPFVEISHISEYGLDQKLSNSIRCF